MIELAKPQDRPARRQPDLLAGGVIGCGGTVTPGLRTQALGGGYRPGAAASAWGPVPPRVAEMSGAMVLDVGLQNRGLRTVLRRCAGLGKAWLR